MIKTLIFNALLVVFMPQAFGIVNGKPIQNIPNYQIQGALVGLTVKVEGLLDDPCSAAWLNRDTLITASHCFILNDYLSTQPKICLTQLPYNSAPQSQPECLANDQYEVKLAPFVSKGSRAPTRKLRKVVSIQIPDVVLVKIKNDEFLNKHPHEILELGQGPATPEDAQLILVGQGCPQYPATRFIKPEGLGTYRWQTIPGVLPGKEGNIISEWKEGDLHGAACWGDSGGPLIRQIGSRKEVLGIISGIKPIFDYDDGRTTSATTLLADLLHPITAQWLKQEITGVDSIH